MLYPLSYEGGTSANLHRELCVVLHPAYAEVRTHLGLDGDTLSVHVGAHWSYHPAPPLRESRRGN